MPRPGTEVAANSASGRDSAVAAGATRPGRPTHTETSWSCACSSRLGVWPCAMTLPPESSASTITGPGLLSGDRSSDALKWPLVTGKVLTCVLSPTVKRAVEALVNGSSTVDTTKAMVKVPVLQMSQQRASRIDAPPRRRLQHRRRLLAGDALYPHRLLQAGLAAHDLHAAARYAQRFGQERAQRLIGCAVDGRRGELHLQPVAHHRTQPLARRPRNHLHVEHDRARLFFDLEQGHSFLLPCAAETPSS